MIPMETELNNRTTTNTFIPLEFLENLRTKNDLYKGKRYIFHGHYMRTMAEILLTLEPKYKLE